MTRTVKMEVSKKDYNSVMELIDTYICTKKGRYVGIDSKKDHNEVQFSCNIFKLNKLIHDVELAKKLGLEVEMEIE